MILLSQNWWLARGPHPSIDADAGERREVVIHPPVRSRLSKAAYLIFRSKPDCQQSAQPRQKENVRYPHPLAVSRPAEVPQCSRAISGVKRHSNGPPDRRPKNPPQRHGVACPGSEQEGPARPRSAFHERWRSGRGEVPVCPPGRSWPRFRLHSRWNASGGKLGAGMFSVV